MPFDFDSAVCNSCTYGQCIEDRRTNKVRGRTTKFRLKQSAAMACTFQSMVPGFTGDPAAARTFEDYMARFRENALAAGQHLFGSDCDITIPAVAKVEGDVYELLIASALWEAAAAWNSFMDSGTWTSSDLAHPKGAVAAPNRKVAFVKLPRNYDATRLFRQDALAAIRAHESALELRNMQLDLSSPDIVGVRLPLELTTAQGAFCQPLANIDTGNLQLLENAHKHLEGTLNGRDFLFAIAVKRTTRSDRLYQPLFEANVLKYLIQEVLRGAVFRFHVVVGSTDGADVEGHYRAASLFSLLRGGEPTLAVDRLITATTPRQIAQALLDDLPYFPL